MFMLPSKFGYIVTERCPDDQTARVKHTHILYVATEVNQIVLYTVV